MSTHRRDVRPRYGRIIALTISATVSAVAALAGLGVLATSTPPAGASARPASYHHDASRPEPSGQQSSQQQSSQQQSSQQQSGPQSNDQQAGGPSQSAPYAAGPQPTSTSAEAAAAKALPTASGHGRRIVFSQSRQRVWLVGDADHVGRTYLVSGSVYDNLQPGTYSVYSRSRWAVGVDESGVMQYFVRFTQGPTGAAIGFHSIPTHDDVPLQTRAQLGTPQSHGCIRQDLPDAIALWNFAPVGTKVVVVA